MAIDVGTSGGNKTVTNVHVGTAGGNKEAVEVWIGTASGNKLVHATSKVTLTASAVDWDTCQLVIGPQTGATIYRVYRDAVQVRTFLSAGTFDIDVPADSATATTWAWRVDAVDTNSTVVGTASASATTPARPTVQKVVTLTASGMQTYDGAGAARPVTEAYFGRISSTFGRQKSAVAFAVPADVRDCVTVEKIELSVKVTYHHLVAGGLCTVAVQHQAVLGSTWAGATETFAQRTADRGGWLGGSEWQAVGWMTVPGRGATVSEEFRTKNADGFALMAPNDSTDYYGYTAELPRMRISYRVWA